MLSNNDAPKTRAMPAGTDRPKSRAPQTRMMPVNTDRPQSRALQADKKTIPTPAPASKPILPKDDEDDEYDDTAAPAKPQKEARSILFTPKDQRMAERQSRYADLNPVQQKENDQWAQEMFKRGGVCPEGSGWVRGTKGTYGKDQAGYHCCRDGHVATDTLIAEGKGGMYVTILYKLDELEGPYYPHPEKPGLTADRESMIRKGYNVLMDT